MIPAVNSSSIDFERKHYVRAILRYLTAIKQQPDSTMAYESIVRANQSLVAAYESVNPAQDAYDSAKREYGDISDVTIAFTNFVRENPDSINADGFVAMIEKLEQVSSRFDNL